MKTVAVNSVDRVRDEDVVRSVPKRILFHEGNTDGTVGGSQRVLLEVIRHLDRSRFEPIVLFYEDHELVPEFRKLARVVFLRNPSLRLVIDYPNVYRALARYRAVLFVVLLLQKIYNFVWHKVPYFTRVVMTILRERVDLVCLNNSPTRPDLLVACKVARRPCVAYFRGTPELTPWKARFVGYHEAILSISEAVTDNARQQGAITDRFTLVYDGIDADAVRGQVKKSRESVRREFLKDPTRPLIGVVNNLKHWKGQHVAVEAMSILHERRPDVVCLLVGNVGEIDHGYAESLKQTVRERGLTENVIFTGRRLDVPDLLNAFDVVLHTSLSNEGFPRIILETMILGRPMIASSSGPNVEMIEDGVSGFLVPPGDAHALADRIEAALADPAKTEAAGRRARERAERLFNIEINMRKTEAVFSKLLAVQG